MYFRYLPKELAMAVPKVFTSEIPVFMPIEYVDIPPMRLDSNVVYYEESMIMGMEAKAEAEGIYVIFDV